MANCYVNLGLFEDAIDFCDQILYIEEDHEKALYRKAKALAGLYEYDKSIEIFNKLKTSIGGEEVKKNYKAKTALFH